MTTKVLVKLLLIGLLLASFSCKEEKAGDEDLIKKTDISQFLGQWTLDIDGGGVGWLEVIQKDKYLDGSILWKGGSVSPVSYMYLAGNVLYAGRDTRKVVREKDAEGKEIRSHMVSTWIEAEKDGENITGYYLSPESNGIGLDSASGWSVADGELINNPVQPEGEEHIRYGNLRTEQEFEDFNIKLEVNAPVSCNSGVYLRGRYEIQVRDSYGAKPNGMSMGALYTRITPSVSAEKPAGTWQTMDITLCERHVTVILNGIKVIDNQPAYGPTGGALTSDVFAPGPIYLQGDHRAVKYRNIVLTPIIK